MNKLLINFDLTQKFFWKSLAKEIYKDNGITACYTGINDKIFNNVIQASINTSKLEASINDLIKFYKNKDIGWSWIITPFNKPNNLEDIFPDYGLELLYSCKTMAYCLSNSNFYTHPKNLIIKKAENIQEMTDWAIVLK